MIAKYIYKIRKKSSLIGEYDIEGNATFGRC